jgi:2-oxoglutarate ferredoxin oxidoreductase subunit delta
MPAGGRRLPLLAGEGALGGKASEIRIDGARCKGCEICVEFCPQKVLVMVDGKAAVADLDKCTACMMCDLRCPDFAITVFLNRSL